MAPKTDTTKGEAVQISRPNLKVARLRIRGTAPYCQNKFSAKALQIMKEQQEAGSTAKGKKKREPKDFDACYEGAQHRSPDGWHGIPCAGFRAAFISACRVVGFQMTRAKLAVFVKADGFDKDSFDPLVRITKGEPQPMDAPVRNASGVVDIRRRPVWAPGWEAVVSVEYDADMFTASDIANLVLRAGAQVGVGEGRPDSKSSNGMGWGTFEIVNEND
jgi:hypothetical protein